MNLYITKEELQAIRERLHTMHKRMTDLEAAFYELKDAFYQHTHDDVEQALDEMTREDPKDCNT